MPTTGLELSLRLQACRIAIALHIGTVLALYTELAMDEALTLIAASTKNPAQALRVDAAPI